MTFLKSEEVLRHLASLIGPLGAEMLASQSIAESNLTNPSPDVRAVAIFLFTLKWADNVDVNAICQRILNEDKDASVRKTALSCLGIHNAGTNDRRVGKILSAIIKDDLEDIEVRTSAYLDLIIVADKPAKNEYEEEQEFVTGQISFPDAIDWQFVNSYLDA